MPGRLPTVEERTDWACEVGGADSERVTGEGAHRGL